MDKDMEEVKKVIELKQYTDKKLMIMKSLVASMLNENERQLNKWGVQTHSMFEWCNYATEELGELAKAIAEYEYRNGGWKDVYDEAIQVATLSLKIAEMIDGMLSSAS